MTSEHFLQTLPDLALLFKYPTSEYPAHAQNYLYKLRLLNRKAAKILEPFVNLVSDLPLGTLQELYTRTFEVQPVTNLDVGYVLFGDEYKRGALLVNLNREMEKADIQCGTDLSDYLPNILKLLPRLENPELRSEMITLIVVPAVVKMIGDFEPEKAKQKQTLFRKHHKTLLEMPDVNRAGILYRIPLETLHLLFIQAYPESEKSDRHTLPAADPITQELGIESQ